MSEQALLQDYKSGVLDLPNRLVMAPMTRSRADNPGNIPTGKLQGEYYGQRASAGLIISEGAQVSERAVGYINTPGIYSKEQVEGWKEVTKKFTRKMAEFLFSFGTWAECPIPIFTRANCLWHLPR